MTGAELGPLATRFDYRIAALEDRARADRARVDRARAVQAAAVRHAVRFAARRGTCLGCIVGAVDEPCQCAPYGDHGPAYHIGNQ